MGFGEALGAFADEHHVRAILEDFAGESNGIADALQRGRGAGAERGAVHDDGVALDAAVEIQVGAVAGVEDRIVFEDDNGGLDGVESGAAGREDGPAGGQGALAAGLAGVDSFVGDVPCAAVNDQLRFHRQSRMAKRIREVKEVKELEEGKDKEIRKAPLRRQAGGPVK